MEAFRKQLPTATVELSTRRARDLALTEVGPDGAVLRNRYDLAEERGKPLSRVIDSSIKAALERCTTTEAALYPRSQLSFERTLRLLSKMGTTQAVVLMTNLREAQGRY